MTRADQRALLREWLQEEVADQWSDAQLNTYLNLGTQEAQKLLVTIDPEAVKKTYFRDLVVPAAGKDAKYPWPPGTWTAIELATSDDGVTYTPRTRSSLALARSGQVSGNVYVPWDAKHFALFPAPTAAVANGIRAIVVPTLVMANDTDENPLPLPFHSLAIRYAEKLAMKAAGEATDRVEAEIKAEEDRAPGFYLVSTQPAFVAPQIDRGY